MISKKSITTTALQNAVNAMTSDESSMFDAVIVCTTDDHQANFWMDRLSSGVCAGRAKVLACAEDWNSSGGAGNGLGTLYAYQKACKLAKEKYDGMDLADLLSKDEISVALFHTAGKGTRMAPLPASENNNKPGVKLPILLERLDGSKTPMTVLEAVIRQTGVYASSRKGRLSVFWGDQVFLPSAPFVYSPTHHIDIMCTLLGKTAPTAEEWTAQGLEKYGVIAVLDNGNAAQVEKVNHATAVNMLKTLGQISRVGPSLGSFSVSAMILDGLCEEYNKELMSKTAKLDTDPHFWMPLTLPEGEYVSLMAQKGISEEESKVHHQRMAEFSRKLHLGENMGLFGAVDVGSDACWWDYGQLKLYSKNNLKLLENDQDAQMLRQFMSLSDKRAYSTIADSVTIDDVSCVMGCDIRMKGSIKTSVMSNVTTNEITSEGAIIINCISPKITAGKNAILYNLISPDAEITADAGSIQVGVTKENGDTLCLKSRMDIDGGEYWKLKLEDLNNNTFEEIFIENKNSNVGAIETKRLELYQQAKEKL